MPESGFSVSINQCCAALPCDSRPRLIAGAWEVSDAPTSYVELLKKSIIGIEIDIKRLEGKFKMSQESSKGDRQGVVNGFESLMTENGFKMARTVEERGAMKDAKASFQ